MMDKGGMFQQKVEDAKALFKDRKVTICTVGLGRVGLPTGCVVCLFGRDGDRR